MIAILNLLLAVLVFVVAAWTLTTRDTFAAVAGFVVYGLLLSLVWVQIQGIDVALTEAALGSGLTGALLLVAATRASKREAITVHEKPGVLVRGLAVLVAGTLSAGLAIVVLNLPEQPPSLAPAVRANLPTLDIGNPITGVLMAFRALDTLLETLVVLIALVGVWSLGRDSAWEGRPNVRLRSDPSRPLEMLARTLPPVGMVIAVYIFWIGADQPGGKFQGATLLAAMWILPMLAGVVKPPAIGSTRLKLVVVAGPAVFLAIGAAGILTADAFLAYPDGMEKLHIKVIEWALLISLAITLALIVAGPAQRGDP